MSQIGEELLEGMWEFCQVDGGRTCRDVLYFLWRKSKIAKLSRHTKTPRLLRFFIKNEKKSTPGSAREPELPVPVGGIFFSSLFEVRTLENLIES